MSKFFRVFCPIGMSSILIVNDIGISAILIVNN